MQRTMQQLWINLCISGNKAEHGGHIWLDHAGALGDTGNGQQICAAL